MTALKSLSLDDRSNSNLERRNATEAEGKEGKRNYQNEGAVPEMLHQGTGGKSHEEQAEKFYKEEEEDSLMDKGNRCVCNIALQIIGLL